MYDLIFDQKTLNIGSPPCVSTISGQKCIRKLIIGSVIGAAALSERHWKQARGYPRGPFKLILSVNHLQLI